MMVQEKKGGNNVLNVKKSQVTLFIILAIIIVAVVLLFFLVPRTREFIAPIDPTIQLEECILQDLDRVVENISKQGGSVNPGNTIMYGGENIEYLCYTNEYYKTCGVQRPLLKRHVEREIFEELEPQIDDCMTSIRDDLERRGYDVSIATRNTTLEIVPNNIMITVSGVSVARGDEGILYDEFEARKRTQLYNLLMLATSIVNWESTYGDSDTMTYMSYYPNVRVEKWKQSDGSTIYKLSRRDTDDKFTFASRSLAWPPGYDTTGETHTPV